MQEIVVYCSLPSLFSSHDRDSKQSSASSFLVLAQSQLSAQYSQSRLGIYS